MAGTSAVLHNAQALSDLRLDAAAPLEALLKSRRVSLTNHLRFRPRAHAGASPPLSLDTTAVHCGLWSWCSILAPATLARRASGSVYLCCFA